ncbi:class A beta-lactamase [Streptomyces sp. ODS28]|uniref:class A beta-lactamase n=1 Tax=Streptomyces sp. ODS28 TaxID=3136688 RepID=UPI0031EF6EA5
MTMLTALRLRTALPSAALALTLALTTAALGGCAPASPASSDSRSESGHSHSASGFRHTEPAAGQSRAARDFARLEERYGARLGVYALDTGTNRTISHRPDERFAHCSTFKLLAASVLLRDSSDRELDRTVHYREADLEEHAPVTSRHVRTGMTLRALMAAAVKYSDATAANLMLRELDGPKGLQRKLRALGDGTTRTDRPEPDLSEGTPGDPRDTSTARAMGTDMRRFAVDDVLPTERREMLTTWLKDSATGARYIRSGVPRGWTVGDKTGHGGWGTRNDIAVAWPGEGRAPVVISLLSRRTTRGADSEDALLAEATKTAVSALG